MTSSTKPFSYPRVPRAAELSYALSTRAHVRIGSRLGQVKSDRRRSVVPRRGIITLVAKSLDRRPATVVTSSAGRIRARTHRPVKPRVFISYNVRPNLSETCTVYSTAPRGSKTSREPSTKRSSPVVGPGDAFVFHRVLARSRLRPETLFAPVIIVVLCYTVSKHSRFHKSMIMRVSRVYTTYFVRRVENRVGKFE